MNNTAYVPPGSLSVFSNNVSNAPTVTPLQEAIMSRMRPFGLTVSQLFEADTNLTSLKASDLKDLPPSPFLPGGLGLVRPEGFPNFQVLSEDERSHGHRLLSLWQRSVPKGGRRGVEW